VKENLTERLADFVAAARMEDLADSARERARIVLIDTVASALMGSRSEEVPQIERLASAVAGPGRSPVVGRPPLANAGAVLVNGYLVTATTVCDVYRPALCHVSPQVFPPALATAMERDVTGADFLLAFALGLEITTRVALGSNYPAFRANGWHSPGVWGPFGGAAAAGTLLGLDARQMRNAFSLAGSQSAGTFAHWGTPTIKFHQSRGALSGYLAATLAETGFEAGADVLTAEDGGLYGTYSDGGLSATVYNMHGQLPWDNRFQALLSAPFVSAVILADGVCGLDQFTPERLKDAELDRYARENVTVVLDDTVEGTGAVVDLELRDGQRLTDRRAVPHGDEQDPLSIDDVTSKFLAAAAGVLPDEAAATALSRLERIDELPGIDGALVGALPVVTA
jgi:2-methylcitrate dehydratase PrpD